MSTTWFITGTSRGIGLQFVKQLVADEKNVVVASCRNPESASDLQALKESAKERLHIVQLDVLDNSSIKAAAAKTDEILGEKGLDYLLNNAGVNPGDDDAFNMTPELLQDAINSNVVGPFLVAQAFVPLLEKGKRKVLMNTTSGLASVGLNLGKKCCAYSISKAALNMLTYKQATAKPDLIAICVDPGWVKTKMGGEGAFLEPEQSVTPFIKFLESLTPEHSGGFFGYEGKPKAR